MDSEELIAALEARSLPPSDFSHERHVQAAWHYLQRAPLEAACAQFLRALRAYVDHVGAQGKFHHTLTIGLLRLVHARGPHPGQDWASFKRAHPDLFNDWRALLACHYSAETLERGRQVLVEPDREPLP